MDELVTAGQSRGVPIAAVLSPAETLASEHFRSVGALTEATIAPGVDVTVPAGPFVVDGQPRRASPGRARRPVRDEAAWSYTTIRNTRRARTARARTGRSTVCGFWISASSSRAANWAGCSQISAPRSSRSRAPPIRTACVRRRRAR